MKKKTKKTLKKLYKWSFDHLETLEAHSAKIENIVDRVKDIDTI